MKNNIVIRCLLVLALVFVVNYSYAATLRYSEDFEDGEIDQPADGTVHTHYGINNNAVEGIHWELSAPGRNGSSCSFKAQTGTGHDSHLNWMYSDAWYTQEVYVSFWLKANNVESPLSIGNLKLFYPRWNGTSSYIHWGVTETGGIYYSARNQNEVMLEQSVWLSLPNGNVMDGTWHQYEWWWKFDTAEVKFWVDGTLLKSANYSNSSWTNALYYIPMPYYDSGTIDGFTWEIDDIEIWDGDPDG